MFGPQPLHRSTRHPAALCPRPVRARRRGSLRAARVARGHVGVERGRVLSEGAWEGRVEGAGRGVGANRNELHEAVFLRPKTKGGDGLKMD